MSTHSHFINNTLNLSLKTIISLLNPQNQSLPPFSLIHLIQFNNVIQLITFPHSSSITHHTPSLISHNEWIITSVLMFWWCVWWGECVDEHVCDCDWWWNERNQESNTFLNISSNEGRECGSSTKHVSARLKYDCGHSDWMLGRSPLVVMSLNKSPASLFWIS